MSEGDPERLVPEQSLYLLRFGVIGDERGGEKCLCSVEVEATRAELHPERFPEAAPLARTEPGQGAAAGRDGIEQREYLGFSG